MRAPNTLLQLCYYVVSDLYKFCITHYVCNFRVMVIYMSHNPSPPPYEPLHDPLWPSKIAYFYSVLSHLITPPSWFPIIPFSPAILAAILFGHHTNSIPGAASANQNASHRAEIWENVICLLIGQYWWLTEEGIRKVAHERTRFRAECRGVLRSGSRVHWRVYPWYIHCDPLFYMGFCKMVCIERW